MRNTCAMCVLLGIVSVLISACAVEPQTPIYYTTTFNKALSDKLWRPGRNTVIVNSFTSSSNNGSIDTCAGINAELAPYTETAAEFAKIIFGSAEGGQRTNGEFRNTYDRIANTNPDFIAKTEKCNSDGVAVFRNVADGEFLVVTEAGGYVYAGKVSVRGGETKTVVLSGSTPKLSNSFNYEHWERYERRRRWEARKRHS